MSLQELNDQNFSEVVEKPAKGLVLVDFWAPWCGPCRILAPIIEELSQEAKNKILVYKLNIDQGQQTAAKFNVKSIPTVILFKDGKPIQTLIGIQPKETYLDLIEKNQ